MVKVQVDQADQQKFNQAVMHGAVTYGGAGLGTAVLASVAMQRAGVRAYRGLTLPFKAFAITSATTAAFIIGADAASRKFELAKYSIDSDSKKTQLSRQAYQASELELATGISDRVATIDTSTLSTKQAVLEWGKEHRYSVVFGGWAASMVGSFAYIAATPLSFAQKLVQARMVAQGLTVVVLLASAGLSAMPGANGGESEDDLKRDFRENTMYKWKPNSAHAAHLLQEKAQREAAAQK